MRRIFSEPQSSELADDVHIKSISSDGNNGFHVTYVVGGQEEMVHFEEADYDSQNESFTKDVDGIKYELASRTAAFQGPDKNQGSSEFKYLDAHLFVIDEPNSRVFATYGARTEAAGVPAGTAVYLGKMDSYNLDRNSPSNDLRIRVRGGLELTADFDASTLEGQIDRIRVRGADEAEYSILPSTTRFAIGNGRIIGGLFAAALTGVDSDTNAPLDETVRGYEGGILGEFYGPSAEEVGGVLDAESEAHDRVMHGWFGGHNTNNFNPRASMAPPRMPLSVGVDRDYSTTTTTLTDAAGGSVTEIEGDGAAGFYVTYMIDGAEHRIHLGYSDFNGREYIEAGDPEYGIWEATASYSAPEFDHFNVNGWYVASRTTRNVWRGHIVDGDVTAVLPAGTAEYDGRMFANGWSRTDPTGRQRISGDLALTADFDNHSVDGKFSGVNLQNTTAEILIQNGAIANSAFTAELAGQGAAAAFEGDMTGQFFGPDAAEVGGVLSAGDADTVYEGWFGGTKQ